MAYSLEIERLVSHKHKLEAEIERLRSALKYILKEDRHYGNMGHLAKAAKAALDGKEGIEETLMRNSGTAQ